METTTYNRTSLSIAEIENLPIVKVGKNNWRNRDITLYQHPEHADRVISDGITFDQTLRVICDEAKSDWTRELNAPGNFIIN